MPCSVPPYLNSGDVVGIVAPAGKIKFDVIQKASMVLQDWGLKVKLGKYLQSPHFSLSSSDSRRKQDFQHMLNDSEVKAILCARGGYGSTRIIDELDFTNFKKNPKWIIGFSDITVFHAHLNSSWLIESLHATMCAGLASGKSSPESLQSLKDTLLGKPLAYAFTTHVLSRKGKAKAELCGGNLAMICSLIGTPSALVTKNKILFIEEIGEQLYRIDRMMLQLRRAGLLSGLEGLVVGGITDIPDKKEDFGKSAEEIVLDAVADYEYPVCFGFPAGHRDDNRALIMGRKLELTVDKMTELRFNY